MSTTVKTGWLNDKNGDKFAPKTLTSQVQTSDGILLEDKIQADLEAAKAEILNNISIDVDSELSSTSEKPVQNKVINAEFEELSTKIDTNLETAKSYTDTQMANIPSVDAYTKAEIDTALEGKADSTHNHDSAYDSKGSANTAANTALESAKSYTDTKTSSLASTSSVNTSIGTHNTSTSAHSDIRELISDLSTIVNNFLDVDDTTKDQLSEVLTLIENNKGTLESLTTTKVNVSDIIDNLTTANADKVLSANQGVAIKALIDDLQTELDEHTHTVDDITDLTVAATELNYMSGVTSNVQTQLDGKSDSGHIHSQYLEIAGGTMTGSLLLNEDPIDNMGAATKQYVDAHTNLFYATYDSTTFEELTSAYDAGKDICVINGTRFGYLTMKNDTSFRFVHNVNSNSNYVYICSVDATGQTIWTTTQYSSVNSAGGTMTGALTLHADPTENLGAATKQYVDTVQANVDALQTYTDEQVATKTQVQIITWGDTD